MIGRYEWLREARINFFLVHNDDTLCTCDGCDNRWQCPSAYDTINSEGHCEIES